MRRVGEFVLEAEPSLREATYDHLELSLALRWLCPYNFEYHWLELP